MKIDKFTDFCKYSHTSPKNNLKIINKKVQVELLPTKKQPAFGSVKRLIRKSGFIQKNINKI